MMMMLKLDFHALKINSCPGNLRKTVILNLQLMQQIDTWRMFCTLTMVYLTYQNN